MYRPFDDFRLAGRLISVIGSGGKTTLLRHLSERLPGKIILTTSTHIYPFGEMPLATDMDTLKSALVDHRVVCLGAPAPNGKLADPSDVVPFERLKSLADWVLIEADGAAGHPLKAHRPWEPVIPAVSDMTVCVIGASGIGRPAREVCHCPELFAALAGISPDEAVTIDHIADIINRESLSDCCLVNQIDALSDPAIARQLCDRIKVDAFCCALSPR